MSLGSPIKRNTSLQAVSREHHHGLLLSFKIRQGVKLHVEPVRIINYLKWFWTNHLKPHFEFEERFMFPVLEDSNPLFKQVLSEHKHIELLFLELEQKCENINLIEKELSEHIRFEERILFKEIEERATKAQLELIEKEHKKVILDEWNDEFWIEKTN